MQERHLIESHLRRDFLRRGLTGIGTLALSQLLAAEGRTEVPDPLVPRKPHFAPKAKNVIFLFQEGAPSQMDLFDPKPALEKMARPVPAARDDEGPEACLH